MANRATQLTRTFVAIMMVSLVLSFLTGLGLWYVHEQREKLAEGLGELPRWTSSCQSLHGLLNPLLCVLFGLMAGHILGGWRMRANHKTGVALTLCFSLLIVTGAALYYSEFRHFYFTIHLLAGLLLPIILGMHWVQARRWVNGISIRAEQERAKVSQPIDSD